MTATKMRFFPSIEGKTKKIIPLTNEPGLGLVVSKDDVTAGDGARHEVAYGKAILANATMCNISEMFKRAGIPQAYVRRSGDDFVTRLVDMIPVEVVVRNEAAGSYCKRNPGVEPGTVFAQPIVEFYYKTTGRQFFGVTLEVDDPLMLFSDDGTRLTLHHPGRPIDHERPLLEVGYEQLSVKQRIKLHGQLKRCAPLALSVTKHLSTAWQKVGGRLVDIKLEFGTVPDGELLLADVVDCDSGRVIWNGEQLSKQPFREGAPVEELLRVYTIAKELTERF